MASFKLSTIICYIKTQFEFINSNFNQLRTNGFGMEPMLKITLFPSSELEFFFFFFDKSIIGRYVSRKINEGLLALKFFKYVLRFLFLAIWLSKIIIFFELYMINQI